MRPPARAQVDELAGKLNRLRVNDVYVYVSYLKADGKFNATYDFAAEFLAALKSRAPQLRALAWIGVPVSIDGHASANRLESADIRQTIADFSRRAVADLGFDGVHINAELVGDGDRAYLDTLGAVRAALPAGALLSATAHPLRLTELATFMPSSRR